MEQSTNRILTVPNAISMVRFLCIPFFAYLVFHKNDEATAAYLLAVLGATDWVDGFIARRYHQESAFGKFFDPAADRLLLAVAGVSLVVIGAMPLWFGIAALVREGAVIIGGVYLATRGVRGLTVEYIGKAGAFGLMFSFPFFLIAHAGVGWHEIATVAAYICGVPGIVLSYISGFHYVKQARETLDAKAVA